MVSSVFFVAVAAGFVSTACGHSHIPYVIANGLQYQGYNNRNPVNPPNSVGWWADNPGDDYITPVNYTSPNIICHRSAIPAPAHLPVSPGDRIHLQWNGWPQSHVGPILTYLARCPDSSPTGCSNVDKTTLKFFPIDTSDPVLLRPTDFPNGVGPFENWITDTLIHSNNSWRIDIPKRLPPGAYVLRHELIALHYASLPEYGAQNYPQCFNLWVSGGGSTDGPAVKTDGILGTELYKPQQPGIVVDIYAEDGIDTYVNPAPPLVEGAAPVPFNEQVPMEIKGRGTPVVIKEGKAVPFEG